MSAKRADRRGATVRAAWLLLGIAMTAPMPGCESSDPRPNILLYVVDTLRADSLAPYGNPIVETPAIERFAREGVLYERAYAPSSWTRPSVASLLSGQLPDAHRVEGRADVAAPELVLLSERLREAGYATAAIVTNPNAGAFYGFDQGYDTFVELFAAPDEETVSSDLRRDRSEVVTQRALEWIDEAPRPFFLFVLTTDPHSPYRPPKAFRKYGGVKDPWPRGPGFELRPMIRRYRSRYWGEVSANDASFGQLLDGLRERGLYDRTAIALTADHGEEFQDHGLLYHGKTLYEEQLRVPLIVRRPGEPEPGRRVAPVVRLIDLAPTLLESAGLDAHPEVDGLSLPPAEGTPPRRVLARLELDGHSARAVVDPPWKLIVRTAKPESELRRLEGGLFQLEDDPFEMHSLRSLRPAVEARLEAVLREREARAPLRGAERELAAPGELPEDVREALEILGYLEPDAPDEAAAETLP